MTLICLDGGPQNSHLRAPQGQAWHLLPLHKLLTLHVERATERDLATNGVLENVDGAHMALKSELDVAVCIYDIQERDIRSYSKSRAKGKMEVV